MEQVKRLLGIIEEISVGRYRAEDVDDLTRPGTEGTVQAVAEALRKMAEKIEAREKHLEMLGRKVQEASLQARRNTIAIVTAMAKALAAPNLTGASPPDHGPAVHSSWGGTGATCAELIVFDFMTNNPVAAARDNRQHGLKERFTEWGSAEDAFQYWADRLALFLEQAREARG